jgi:hypothetical protein
MRPRVFKLNGKWWVDARSPGRVRIRLFESWAEAMAFALAYCLTQ